MEISSGYRFLSYRYPLRIRDYSIDRCELDLSLEDNFNGTLRIAFTLILGQRIEKQEDEKIKLYEDDKLNGEKKVELSTLMAIQRITGAMLF